MAYNDLMSKEKRRIPILVWFERTFKVDDACVYFPNVEIISRLMNNQYNVLRKKFPSLTIERHLVLFQPNTKQDCLILSTNTCSPRSKSLSLNIE
jgi:hypothetical protein